MAWYVFAVIKINVLFWFGASLNDEFFSLKNLMVILCDRDRLIAHFGALFSVLKVFYGVTKSVFAAQRFVIGLIQS